MQLTRRQDTDKKEWTAIVTPCVAGWLLQPEVARHWRLGNGTLGFGLRDLTRQACEGVVESRPSHDKSLPRSNLLCKTRGYLSKPVCLLGLVTSQNTHCIAALMHASRASSVGEVPVKKPSIATLGLSEELARHSVQGERAWIP